MAPTYISGLITIKSNCNFSLRSNNELLLKHPRVRTAPKLWNVLPDTLREITSVDSFKAHLKTYTHFDTLLRILYSHGFTFNIAQYSSYID